jgi:Fe2+ transport system protein FeoA
MQFGRHGNGARGIGGRGRERLCDTLDSARSGDELEILEVGDEHARVSALRFGMAEGAHVSCVTRIPAGPIIIRSGRQEIAIGRGLARRIRVRRAHDAIPAKEA